MKGKVLAAVSDAAPGLISGDDGRRYRFDASTVRSGHLRAGQEVDFDISGDMAVEIYALTNQYGLSPEVGRGWINFYFSSTGRVSRRQYWLYGVLVTFVVSVVLGWIPVVGQILGLAAFWSSIALSFKRCHDVGRSGWWSFLPAIPLVLTVVVSMVEAANHAAMAGTILLAIVTLGSYVWVFVAVYVRRGEPGPNRFGPDPLGLPIA